MPQKRTVGGSGGSGQVRSLRRVIHSSQTGNLIQKGNDAQKPLYPTILTFLVLPAHRCTSGLLFLGLRKAMLVL